MGNSDFIKDLENCINKHCQENESNTPDYILAEFLNKCLSAWNDAICQRELWHGRHFCPGSITSEIATNYIIIVNGEEKLVEKPELTYQDVIDLAATSDEEKKEIFSITYRKAAGEKQKGILAPGESVCIKDGTTFSAFVTDCA